MIARAIAPGQRIDWQNLIFRLLVTTLYRMKRSACPRPHGPRSERNDYGLYVCVLPPDASLAALVLILVTNGRGIV